MTRSHALTRRYLALAIVGLGLCGTALSAQAPTAATLYQRATDKEAALRAAPRPAPDDVKRTIAAYELVVQQFPNSGYCDNALWQAAGVALLGYRQEATDATRAKAEQLLKWLTTQYPSSPFVKQADERLRAFTASARPTAPASEPLAPAPSKPAAASGTATLRGISREALSGGDRIVLDVDREVSFVSDRIAGPDRVFLDLKSTAVGDGVPAAAAALKGMLVSGVRLGHPVPGTTRIVIDLAGAPKHSIYPLYSPYRLVIDAEGPVPPPLTRTEIHEPVLVAPAAAASAPSTTAPAPAPAPPPAVPPAPERPALATAVPALPSATEPAATSKPSSTAAASVPVPPPAAPAAPPSPTARGNYSLARQLGLSVQRIVIDAGHGGHDPGAQGNGLVEKDLVLDVALRLQQLLQAQPGFEVVLTRSTDEFIPLEERTSIANRAGADMFLSIHANASTHADVRGLETYFLNFATTRDAETIAARENATSSQNMGHLPEILKTIARNTKLAESRELATMVQTSMVKRLKTTTSTPRDLGVKQAPFVVLIGAEMPSVLAEISFVTNRADATSLKDSATKQRIAQALFDGILKYQTSLKKVTNATSKTP